MSVGELLLHDKEAVSQCIGAGTLAFPARLCSVGAFTLRFRPLLSLITAGLGGATIRVRLPPVCLSSLNTDIRLAAVRICCNRPLFGPVRPFSSGPE
jgi:hypothetical protein